MTVDVQAAPVESFAQVAQQRQPLRGPAIELLPVALESGVLTLGGIHGDVGTSQHRGCLAVVVGHRSDTDADRDHHVEVVELER
jgi:hypothetical protein